MVLKNRSNEIRTNEIRIRREPSVNYSANMKFTNYAQDRKKVQTVLVQIA